MVELTKTTLVLWLVPMFAQGVIAIAIYLKKLHKELPLFFSYIAFQAVRSPISVAILTFGHQHTYFLWYWSAEGVSAILGLAVVYELFETVLTPYRSIQKLGNWLFLWACLVVVAVASVAALDRGNENDALMSGIYTLERSARMIQAGLLLFLFGFARSLNLSWRHYVTGIAAGFSLFVGLELLVVTVTLQTGQGGNIWYQLLKPVTYDGALFIWALYVLRGAPVASPVPATIGAPELTELERWNLALAKFL